MSRFIKKALEKVHRLEKNQLQEVLRDVVAENDLYETALNSLAGGLIVSDVNAKVLFQNKAAERLLPLHHSELPDRILWSVIRDEDVARFVRVAFESQETVTGKEFVLEGPPGARILNLSLLPLVRDGKIRGSILVIQDVTERKNKESRLRRAESLASLTTLAAGVAHEIKNPLASIGIHLQLIQKSITGLTGGVSESVDKCLNVIGEEVDRLNHIVVDFLFAVRPMDTTLTAGSLNKVVKDLVDFLQYELKETNIDVVMDLESGDDTILMDERFLKQAFLNIIKNSQHAMPEGGKLTISTVQSKGQVQVRISDTGKGIPDNLLEKIFEPYFTTKEFGSGLGLTLVYKIVKEHGADIQVNSKVGQGTSITLVFPVPQRETPLLAYKGEAT